MRCGCSSAVSSSRRPSMRRGTITPPCSIGRAGVPRRSSNAPGCSPRSPTTPGTEACTRPSRPIWATTPGDLARTSRCCASIPQQPKLWTSYGHALRTTGKVPESIAAYRRALSMESTLGEAWWSLANLKTFRFSDADVRAHAPGALARRTSPMRTDCTSSSRSARRSRTRRLTRSRSRTTPPATRCAAASTVTIRRRIRGSCGARSSC